MTTYEFLKINSHLLALMHKNGISAKDVVFIEIANKAKAMLDQGEKKRYVIKTLANEYAISERSVYTYIDKMDAEIML